MRSTGPISHITQSRTQKPSNALALLRATSGSRGRLRETNAKTGIVASTTSNNQSGSVSLAVTRPPALRTVAQIPEEPGPKENQRPALFARGQFDLLVPAAFDFPHDVVQPPLVEYDVFEQTHRRARF